MKFGLLLLMFTISLTHRGDNLIAVHAPELATAFSPSHDAIFFYDKGLDNSNQWWNDPAQKLIPYPLGLIYHPGAQFGIRGGTFEPRELTADEYGALIFDNLQNLQVRPPAVMQMNHETVHNLSVSH